MRYLSIALLAALLHGCGRPSDLARAQQRIDSALAVERADSVRLVAVRDSLRDGHHQYRDTKGRLLMEGELRGGHRQGVWTSYGSNGGVLSRNEYVDGELNGSTIVFRSNGTQYYVGTNRQGKPFGLWNFYDDQGKLVKTLAYDSTGAVVQGASNMR